MLIQYILGQLPYHEDVICIRKLRTRHAMMSGNHLILRRREIHKPEGHVWLRRPGHGWNDNIEVYLKELGREAVDW